MVWESDDVSNRNDEITPETLAIVFRMVECDVLDLLETGKLPGQRTYETWHFNAEDLRVWLRWHDRYIKRERLDEEPPKV